MGSPNTNNKRLAPGLRAALAFALSVAVGMAAPAARGADLAADAPAIALFYGADAPLNELKAFDIAVVDSTYGYDPATYHSEAAGASSLYAYLSLGEVPEAAAGKLPPAWKLASNPVWKSAIVDQTASGWRDHVLDQRVAPLVKAGYRGLFLDTLDAFSAVPKIDAGAQQRALAETILSIHRRYPDLRLIANRGFEILPQIHDALQLVAAESLFRAWNERQQRYEEVAEADRVWLQARLAEVRDRYRLPTLAIDYVDPRDRALMRETAARIARSGSVPFVADGRLQTLGLGQREVIPRKLLVLFDGDQVRQESLSSSAVYAAMPLQYLGLVPEYHDLRQPLPTEPLVGRAAGILLWPANALPNGTALANWLAARRAESIPIVFMGQFGLSAEALSRRFDLRWQGGRGWKAGESAAPQAAMLGFESPPTLPAGLDGSWRPQSAKGVEALLTIVDDQGQIAVPAAITDWGGYCLDPFLIADLPGTGQQRWILDPFAFFAKAFRLPAMPVPDTTTENGRRILVTHIDGDGYPSRAELPGSPPAAEVLLERILKKYRVPTSLSLIEAEVSPNGLFPADSPRLEAAARASFALDHVETATHTYSHPFDWLAAFDGEAGEPGEFYLAIPDYRFDLKREIVGSAAYVSTLAPPDKAVRLVFWSGTADPPAEALAIAEAAGFRNLNGGDTWITRDQPTLTAVTALGVHKRGHWQTLAPIMNENRYTNLWNGPYWGYRRVIETFEMTGSPRRLKPINIYYHSYSASKVASLNALTTVYDWALAQRPTPLFASEYVALAEDFNRIAIAREGESFIVRGKGDLRSLRLPAGAADIDPTTSTGVAGYSDTPEGRFVSLASADARIAFKPKRSTKPSAAPYLVEANRRLSDWARGSSGISFRLTGFGVADFTVAAKGCTADGKALKPTAATAGTLRFQIDDAVRTIPISCR